MPAHRLVPFLLRPGLALGLLLALGAGLAHAQALPGSDSSKPIEITADKLVVQQEKQLAIFSGDVEAVQGEMSLKSDLLRVYYNQDEGGAGPSAAQGSIRRIEAEGKVLLTSPTDTAQGDRGVYDPVARKVTLDGNVVLTRDDNVVKGASLEMDLATGVSTVHAAPPGSAGKAERVRAVFQPQKKGG